MRCSRVLAASLLAVLAGSAAACDRQSATGQAVPPGAAGEAISPTPPAPTGSTAAPAGTASAATSDRVPSATGGGLLPLWPFRTLAEARAWQQDSRSGGQQPWHASAEQTALSFVTGYLGFTEIDRVAQRDIRATEAHVTVGSRTPSGQTSTAAVIHLVRFGTEPDSPWEVVGTRDTTLSLTTPAYGATATSPLRVGGRITGVDESIRVTVRQGSASRALGEACCLPAGGTNSAWSTVVRFDRPTSTVLTVVAATGGHLTAVERFTVTGVLSAVREPIAGQPVGTARDGDVDGDGLVDAVSLPQAGLLRVRYAAGGGDDVRYDGTTGPGGALILGVVDTDRDGRAEVVLRVTAGASTGFASLFRYVSGHLRLVTVDGQQARLGYGGTVTHAAAWACRQPAGPITSWTGTSTDGTTYRGTESHYRFDGTRLALTGTRPRTVTPTAPAPSGCGSLVLR